MDLGLALASCLFMVRISTAATAASGEKARAVFRALVLVVSIHRLQAKANFNGHVIGIIGDPDH